MARMTGCRVHARTLRKGMGLVMCAGGAIGIVAAGGCGKGDRWWKKNKEPVQAADDSTNGTGSVDTSLTALSNGDDSLSVEGVDTDGFESTQDQVIESVRMMNEYFSGMESGVNPAESVVIHVPVEPVDSAASRSPGDDGRGDMNGGNGSFSLSQAAAERGLDVNDEPNAERAAEVVVAESDSTPIEIEPVDTDAVATESVDAEQRKAILMGELVSLLTEIARTSDNPGSAAAALAGLDSISIETLDGLYQDGVLSESELSTLRAAREVFDSISSSGAIESPEAVAEVLDRVKGDLDRMSGIRVTRALLCTRVDGFGKYEPFASNEFLAGRAQEVIVYVEVDRFGHREMTGTDGQPRYEVELSQRLELYHVADDLNTWNRAAEIDRSVSRNRVRDYYLINKVTLPANLGVGRYHLKVVMRDLVDEKVSELIIPIRMVAN